MSRSDAMRLVTAAVVLTAWAQTWAQTKAAPPTSAEAAAAAAGKPRVAVVDFAVSGDAGGPEMGSAVSELLLAEFDLGRFALVERTMLTALLKEKDLTIAAVVDDPMLLKAKGVRGVQYLVVGKVVRLGNLSISARMVDVRTGEIARVAKVSADDARGLQAALGELALALQVAPPDKKPPTAAGGSRRTATIWLQASQRGMALCQGKEYSLEPNSPAAVLENVPVAQPLGVTFTPSGGTAQKFTMDLRRCQGSLIMASIWTGMEIAEKGMGVPADSQKHDKLLAKGETPAWTADDRETAGFAALADLSRNVGERLRARVKFNRDLPQAQSQPRNRWHTYYLNGARITSYTVVKDWVAQQDYIQAEIPLDSGVVELRVHDFVPAPQINKNVTVRQVIAAMEKLGISCRLEFRKTDYIADALGTFKSGLILIEP